jgi:hypothetical protein
MVLPVTRAMGSVHDVPQLAAPPAMEDVWRAGFPIAMVATLAHAPLFQRLSPNNRGIAAVATLGLAGAGITAAARTLG